MSRRIIFNIILAFLIFPAIMLIQGYSGRYILHQQNDFSGDFWGYTVSTLRDIIPVISLGLLLLILLPYNLILSFFKSKYKHISLIAKIGIFLSMEVIESLFASLWRYSSLTFYGSLEFFLFLCIISTIMVSIHHWLIDSKVMKTAKI